MVVQIPESTKTDTQQQKRKHLLKTTMLLILVITVLSFSIGAPPGRTGAPDELTCEQAGCHGASAEFDGEIIFRGFPAVVPLAQKFDISVAISATEGAPAVAGMSLVALGRVDGELVSIGNLLAPGPNTEVDDDQRSGRQYLSHSPAAPFNGSNVVTFDGEWETPTSLATDTVYLYASAVLANGNGSNSGDKVILASRAMTASNTGIDADNDGFEQEVDCDDNNPDVNPDAEEIINNDIDENCDGIIEEIDFDGDGFNEEEDCNDRDATVNPDAADIPNNSIDENCDGIFLMIDEDGDGFNSELDCNDEDPNINPDATEIPNNDIDENCDGELGVTDDDNDGFNSDVDCDDNNPDINPSAVDIIDNGIDEDCSGRDSTTAKVITGSILDIFEQPVSGVQFLDASTLEVLATSDASGAFSIDIDRAGQSITLSKEASAGEGISSSDLVQIANHILNRIPFANELQIDAADVNNSGSVSANDLVLMKRILLNLSQEFPGRSSWQFVPAQIDQDTPVSLGSIRAYKLGDVNGSAPR